MRMSRFITKPGRTIIQSRSIKHFHAQYSSSGLESGTRYHFALQQEGSPIGNQSFMTFPENGACSFIVYGDTREQAPYFTQIERHRIVADRIAR